MIQFTHRLGMVLNRRVFKVIHRSINMQTTSTSTRTQARNKAVALNPAAAKKAGETPRVRKPSVTTTRRCNVASVPLPICSPIWVVTKPSTTGWIVSKEPAASPRS